MKVVKKIILFLAIILVFAPLINVYLLNEKLGNISFGLFSIGILIHSVNLINIGIQRIKKKKNYSD
jgi:membrane protein required for beta-lactamase induction